MVMLAISRMRFREGALRAEEQQKDPGKGGDEHE
jgi:hypothetical protein